MGKTVDIIENPLNANFANAGVNLNYIQEMESVNSTDSLSQ